MTEKQEKILNAALVLFAQDGFKTTSTSKIAKKAGVSEGLIFRHFENKDGLLTAIIQEGEEKAKALFADIVMEMDAKKVIRKSLDLALSIHSVQEDSDFWKLQYKIKWELEKYGEYKMEPLLRALTQAFKTLGYEQPEQEALLFQLTMDGIATRLYLGETFELDPMIEFLKKKYDV